MDYGDTEYLQGLEKSGRMAFAFIFSPFLKGTIGIGGFFIKATLL